MKPEEGNDMQRGPMSEDPEFRTVSAPDNFPSSTDAAVRFVPVIRQGTVVGYVWAAVTDDAAGFVPRQAAGDAAFNTAVAWVRRFRWAKASGLAPSQVLGHWAGEPEDDKTGRVPENAEDTAPSLAALKERAAR
jgi:hypothetical protein